MEDWTLIESMVSLLHKELKIPVTCKVRVYDSVEKTIQYVLGPVEGIAPLTPSKGVGRGRGGKGGRGGGYDECVLQGVYTR